MKWPSKKTIRGCEARGDADSDYLTRWLLWEWRGWSLCLHCFHRSDADDLHDHPWGFVSLILWGGYYEHTFKAPDCVRWWPEVQTIRATRRARKYPGMVLFRRADHAHRVELVNGKPAWTLVLRTPRVERPWGFFTSTGRETFTSYFERLGC